MTGLTSFCFCSKQFESAGKHEASISHFDSKFVPRLSRRGRPGSVVDASLPCRFNRAWHRPHVGLTAGVGFFFALNRVTTGNRFGGPLAKERRNAWRTRTALLKSCGRPLFGQAQGVTIVCEKRLASVWQPLGVVVQTRSDRPIYGLRQCDSPPDSSQGVVSLALSLCRFASKGNDL